MRSFSIDLDGHTYRGTWKLRGGDQIEVASDYGTSYVNLNGRDPSVAAREALAKVVAVKRRQTA